MDGLAAAYLLKRFFAELPEPVIPVTFYERFIKATTLPAEVNQVRPVDSSFRIRH
jgi:hypothetical protein